MASSTMLESSSSEIVAPTRLRCAPRPRSGGRPDPQCQLQLYRLAGAQDRQRDRVARLVLAQDIIERVLAVDPPAVDGGDDVAVLQAGSLGRCSGTNGR